MPSKLSNNIPPTDFTKNCQGYYLFTANQINLNILMRTSLYDSVFFVVSQGAGTHFEK